MVTIEDLESFFIRMDLEYEELDEGMYLVRMRSNGGTPIVVHHSPPLLLLRAKVMDLDADADYGELFRVLLELNVSDVVHGAYGIEEGELVISDTLELETLDFHELQASAESLQLALSGHIERIRSLVGKGEEAAVGEGEN